MGFFDKIAGHIDKADKRTPPPSKKDYPVKEQNKARKSVFSVNNGQKSIDVFDRDDENSLMANTELNNLIREFATGKNDEAGWNKRAKALADGNSEANKEINNVFDSVSSILENPRDKNSLQSAASALNDFSNSIDTSALNDDQKAEFESLLKQGFQIVAAAQDYNEKSPNKTSDEEESDANQTTFTVNGNNKDKNITVYDKNDASAEDAQNEVKTLSKDITEGGETSWENQAKSMAGEDSGAQAAIDNYLAAMKDFNDGNLNSKDSIQKMSTALNELNDAVKKQNLSPDQEAKLNRLLEQGFQVVAGIVDVANKQGNTVAERDDVHVQNVMKNL